MKKLRAHFTLTFPLSVLEAEGMTQEQAIEELRSSGEALKEESPEGVEFAFRAEVIDE